MPFKIPGMVNRFAFKKKLFLVLGFLLLTLLFTARLWKAGRHANWREGDKIPDQAARDGQRRDDVFALTYRTNERQDGTRPPRAVAKIKPPQPPSRQRYTGQGPWDIRKAGPLKRVRKVHFWNSPDNGLWKEIKRMRGKRKCENKR